METFEQFLESIYDELDNDSNNMNEAFENRRNSWFENLEVDQVIKYADLWAKKIRIEAKEEVIKNFEPHIKALDTSMFAMHIDKDELEGKNFFQS